MGIYMGWGGAEKVVSPLGKSPEIRKLGKRLLQHGFIERQECRSRKRLAESADGTAQGSLAASRMIPPRGRVSACAPARAEVRAHVCPPQLHFQTAVEKPPQQGRVMV